MAILTPEQREDVELCFQMCNDCLRNAARAVTLNNGEVMKHIDDATVAIQMAEPYVSEGMPEMDTYRSLLKKCDIMWSRYGSI